MRFTEILAASVVAQFVAAHGGVEGAPKFFGLPRELRRGNPFARHHAARAVVPLVARQGGNAEGRCGTQGGGASCATGFCCSSEGYCGNTKEHCAAPDCQIDFGPGCDANKTPAGESTVNDARPQLGSIAYGGWGIRSCIKPDVVAITYDDGPYIYTEQVMAKFEARGGHATFFITGNNIGKGAIDENWRDVITKMEANGHQIASHTWSHQNLDAITKQQRYDQMTKNEMALRNILGKYPTYMRPPYSACESAECQADLQALGYVITSFDLDTDDYNQLTPEKIQVAKDNFKEGIDAEAHLAIGHDIHELTALNLTDYMLEYVYSNGLRAVTVGECMNDPEANWYRSSKAAPAPSPSSSAPVPTPTGPTSTDGMCGATGKDQSCIGFVQNDGLLGECCSQYGYCGNTDGHCGTSSGCQLGFGKCGFQPSASPSASKAASTTGPVPTPTGPTSTDGTCGTANGGQSCIGFNGPDGLSECCSAYGWCGNSADHCGASAGCQAGFGKCGEQAAISSVSISGTTLTASQASTAPSATPSSSGEISPDSSCGGENGYTCAGFKTLEGAAAECCSQWGYCGNTDVHCGTGCNPVFGSCGTQAASLVNTAKEAPTLSFTSFVVFSSSATQPTPSPAASDEASVSVPASEATGTLTSSTSSSIAISAAKDDLASPSTSVTISSTEFSTAEYTDTTPVPSTILTANEYSASAITFELLSTPVATVTSLPTYAASSFSTAVKPSSTPCSTTSSITPSPTAETSKDGKCGEGNGGQTCAGYKNTWGVAMGCCCKQTGKCSVDPWACGVGCDKGYGKCWY